MDRSSTEAQDARVLLTLYAFEAQDAGDDDRALLAQLLLVQPDGTSEDSEDGA